MKPSNCSRAASELTCTGLFALFFLLLVHVTRFVDPLKDYFSVKQVSGRYVKICFKALLVSFYGTEEKYFNLLCRFTSYARFMQT